MSEIITEETIHGLGHLKTFFAAFEKLAPVGTERHKANNQTLLFSQYASLVLLSMFNPAIQCVRGLSNGSALNKVQKLIGGGRVSIGSLSESVRVFDPRMLESIIEGLIPELPQQSIGAGPLRHIPDSIPREIAEKLVATDGSSFRVLPQIVNAIGANHDGKWKPHLQFRVLKGSTRKGGDHAGRNGRR